MKRIGIFGGSFNPVHRGHLALASYACSELNLDKVYFVPAYRNPLCTKDELLPGAFRSSLIKKSIRAYPKFSVSDLELKRGKISYTVDTLRAFKKRFGRNTQLYFLAGADTPRHFSRWKSPREVLKLCRFVVLSRSGSKLKTGDGRFLWLPMPPIDVSSSGIRRKLEQGKKVGGFLPKEIEKEVQRRQRSKVKRK